jgi:hypothetical protein
MENKLFLITYHGVMVNIKAGPINGPITDGPIRSQPLESDSAFLRATVTLVADDYSRMRPLYINLDVDFSLPFA